MRFKFSIHSNDNRGEVGQMVGENRGKARQRMMKKRRMLHF